MYFVYFCTKRHKSFILLHPIEKTEVDNVHPPRFSLISPELKYVYYAFLDCARLTTSASFRFDSISLCPLNFAPSSMLSIAAFTSPIN